MYRVLVADGDEASRVLLTEALSGSACQVQVASSGKEALRHMAERGADVLVAEVHLRDMPAWVFVPKVREIDPDIPVVAITADDSWETSKRARVEGGAISFYALKPLDLQEMQQAVRHLARWRQRKSRQGEEQTGRRGDRGTGREAWGRGKVRRIDEQTDLRSKGESDGHCFGG